ncbi:Brl1p [Rhizophagus irregularis DAOM 197198w]|uniref:Brl1p n=1 Tax=Rhizophagus irregularis (strain DAOM 197198w) TaxID=1432141 RepID=A0A015LFJ5_RHIIW|nr:Brl1p [Rhizophagus irregularis DAOM 197198w]
MEKEKRVKLELRPTTYDTSNEKLIDNGPKKRQYASTSSNFTFSEEHNKKFGYGPPFLFALPEPIKSPWKRLNSPNFRKNVRPISGNAIKRVEGKRKYNPPFTSEDTHFNFPEEGINMTENSDIKPKSEGCDLVRLINHVLDMAPKIFIIAFSYYVFRFFWAIQQAIEIKVDEYSQEMHRSISECSKSYLDNRCTPGDRVPALEKVCSQWEKCMNRDPTVLARAKISAEALGEIINNLMEQFSYKTMLFMIAIVLAILLSRAIIEMIKTRIFNNYSSQETPHTHSGMHPISVSPRHMTPMQTHPMASMQHHMSPGSPSTPQHNNVGVYYVFNPKH